MGEDLTCCSCGNDSCTPKQQKKQIIIDFLYLDLSVCERCQGTESNLDAAISDVSTMLKAAGFEIAINKVNITTKELAIKYQFVSSPTIRINGNDIAMEAKESSCKDCGDLCGDNVDCRVWIYEDSEYTEPPKEFLINAILKEVYSDKGISKEISTDVEYKIPDNLVKYFEAFESKKAKVKEKPKVAFICVHNSCRSQIAEALGKLLASDVFESYSAGTELKDRINPDAVRLMKIVYGIDIEATGRSKLIADIPNPDVVITMGCNVNFPVIPCKLREDWGLDDPTGKSDEEFKKTIQKIERKILDLKERLV